MDSFIRNLDAYTVLALGIGIGMIISGVLIPLIDKAVDFILTNRKKK